MLRSGTCVGVVVCVLLGACGSTKRNGTQAEGGTTAGGTTTGESASGGGAGTPTEPEPDCPSMRPESGSCSVPGQVCRYVVKDACSPDNAEWTVTCLDGAWSFGFLGSFDCPATCPPTLPASGLFCNAGFGTAPTCHYATDECERVATCEGSAWVTPPCTPPLEGAGGHGGESGAPNTNEAGQGGAR